MTRRKILSLLAAGSLLMLTACSGAPAASEAPAAASATEDATAGDIETVASAIVAGDWDDDAQGAWDAVIDDVFSTDEPAASDDVAASGGEAAADTVTANVLSPEYNVSGVTEYDSQKGQLVDVQVSHNETGNVIVAKYYIASALDDKMMLNMVLFNIFDLVQNEGGSAFDEAQVWAQAPTTDGEDVKFVQFTLSKPVLELIAADGCVPEQLLALSDDLWVLPSMESAAAGIEQKFPA